MENVNQYKAPALKIIRTIKAGQEKQNANIQEALLLATMHAITHGDVSLYDQIMDATKGSDRKAIAKWAVSHGVARAKDKAFALNKTRAAELADITLDDLRQALPLWTDGVESKGSAIRAFDLNKRILSLIAQAEKAKDDGILEHAEKLEALRGLVA